MSPDEILISSAVTIRPDVMVRQVGDDTVILDLASGKYFGLDPVGTRIWALISNGLSLAQVCATIADEYEVARADAEHDLRQLLSELETNGLIQLS